VSDQTILPPSSDISQISIEEEMKRSYLDYAMSVIVSRALPDVRDGLKPVHRRILYAMKDGGYDSTKPYKKSARIVGDVMGKYHPHGDAAIYDAMVRMAQDFSMRLPLIDGQGNFGSMDGDPPAAMRYTEARLGKTAETLLEDIDKETVSFQANYGESILEPTVLPARFPNLLVNGAGGIAVGMATNIPTHNLGEVIDACFKLIDNPDATIEELMEVLQGPDFPTGAIILGRNGIRSAFHTGRGSIVMRARTTIEEIRKDRQAIVINDVPYQVNKARLQEIIAEQVNEKVIEGISEMRDESDREGVRIVIELKRDAMPDVVLNQLFKHTPLQTSFGVNMLALRDGRPELLNIKQVLEAFLIFREQVIVRRTEFELGQARDRAHILLGLAVAVANLDEVIKLIRSAPDPAIAREQLMARDWSADDILPLIELVDGRSGTEQKTYRLSEIQAKAILDLRLHRLTGLERDKIANDLKELIAKIEDLIDILRNRPRVLALMREEMQEIRDRFSTPRRTAIEDLEFETDIEDLIQREDMVVTVSQAGYVKRVPLSTYRAQRRGGKGRTGMTTKDEDFVQDIFISNTHTPMLFFSSRGMVYQLKVYKLPLGNPQARGKALVNLLPLQQGEVITAVMRMPEDEASWANMYAMFATSAGTVRRNKLSDFTSIRQSGLIAMKLEEGEKLISVHTCDENDDVLLGSRSGKCIRFPVTDIRIFSGRNSMGVRGIKLAEGDELISMSIVRHVEASPEERLAYLRAAALQRRAESGEADAGEPDVSDEEGNVQAVTLSPERMKELAAAEQFVLTISAQGFGKRTSTYEYRISGRGGSGIWGMNMSGRNNAIVATMPVENAHDLMLVTNGGQLIRMPVKDIRMAGRATQGVTLFRIGGDEKVVSAALIHEVGEQEVEAEIVE
jgi:DNA gyrase subunit A